MARPTTEQPSAEQAATLTDDELREVAAGAASGIDYVASSSGFPSRRRSQPDTALAFISDPSSDGDMTLT